MPLPTYYNTGIASVANGATTITFTDALLGSAEFPTIIAGDLFADPAQPLVPPQRIASIDYTAKTAALAVAWPGTSLTDDPYEVRFVGDVGRSTAQTRRLLEQMSVVEANGRGLFYLFSTTTADADPGAGYLRLNHATIGSATAAYLDNLDADGATVSAELDTWDDSTSTVRGKLWVRKITDPSVFHAFNVTGSVVDGTGYRKLTLAYVGGSGTFAADDELMVFFAPKGDAGANGADGADGADGLGVTPASASAAAKIDLAEQTTNGTNKVTVQAPSSVASDKTVTLPDATGTVSLNEATQTVSGVKTFAAIPVLSGGGVSFPATQVPSSDANTLDDYEEGTWTPVLSFAGGSTGITYSGQQGTYVKVGQAVVVEARILLSSKGSSTGIASIGGLPFNHTATFNAQLPVLFLNMSSVGGNLQLSLNPSSASGSVWYRGGATGYSQVADTQFTNTTQMYFSGAYQASA